MTDSTEWIIEGLRAWSPMIASGYECPAAASTMNQAADMLAAKNAEIERLTRERDDAKLLAQNNLDWFNLLKPDFDTAIRQRDTLKEALEKIAGGLKWSSEDVARAALASLDQPAEPIEGAVKGPGAWPIGWEEDA